MMYKSLSGATRAECQGSVSLGTRRAPPTRAMLQWLAFTARTLIETTAAKASRSALPTGNVSIPTS